MHPIKTVKKVAKKTMAFMMSLPIMIKIISVLLLCSFIVTAVDWVIEIFTAKNNPEDIYSILEVEDVEELVEIKESPDGSGYYLDFVSDFNEKVEEIVEKANNSAGLHNLPTSTEFIKKIIKAEVITQFPDLGGNIPEGSDGFQGAIDIRRVTPNKEIGSIDDNPGRGETSTIEKETVYDTVIYNKEDEETLKEWTSGQKLFIKGKAYVYEQTESMLKPGTDTGDWHRKTKEGTINQYITINDGTEVTYTGTYKASTNELTKETVFYVEVDTGSEKAFVKSTNLMLKSGQEDEDQATTENESISKVENTSVTSRAKNGETKTAGKEGETYTIAIAAGHNNTDDTGARKGSLKEEELTIKTAEKVEELLSGYSNIKVVQVGSTSENRSDVKVTERKALARNANPDLCIQIHFDAGGGSGVQAIYKEGDGISQQLAEMLSESMASSMGLPNRGAGPDVERCAVGSLGIIENAATSGFPSVVTEGGFIDGEPDATLLKGNGTDLCAEGIVEGILKYLKADHSGYTSTSIERETVQESIESKVYNLKYVTPEELDTLITDANNGNSNAKNQVLKVYTLDEDNNLITTSWEMKYTGNIEYKKNSPMNFRTALQNYIMPYEYLLFFYMDTNEIDFSEKLADEVLNTEIVIAVQDNVTTTKTTETTIEKKVTSMEGYGYEKVVDTEVTTTEICTPRIEITYVDGWCAKYYKENSYSSKALDWKDDDEEKILNIKGKVTITPSNSSTGDEKISSGTESTGIIDEDGNDITYNYTIYNKVDIEQNTMSIQYDSGEAKVKGNENKFVKVYQDTKAYRMVREYYLFEILENNERTAKLLDLTKYLMYKATGISYGGIVEYDFSEFDLSSFGNVSSNGGISLTTPVLTRELFIQAMEAYGPKSGNSNFIKNFMPYAGEIYDVSVASGVNPELVVVTAKTEQNFKAGGGSYNYWGIAVYNGSSYGSSFGSLADGIRGYASVIKSYEQGSHAETIIQRYEERKAAGCNPLGYGLPGTLSGMQSIYSDLCGSNTKHREGNSSDGGNYYLRVIYGSQFAEKCGNVHRIGIDDYTVTEHADYTAYQVQQKIDVWNDIFGDYGSLAGSGGEIKAASGDGYSQTYTSSTGRTYLEYKQWMGSYANKIFSYYGKTMASSGCSLTSIAVVTSGYNNNQTPGSLASRTPLLASLLTEGGAQCSGYEKADAARLTSGKPAVVNIKGTLVTERGSKYYGGHYIAILDGRNGNEVYVSDVGANDVLCGGWTNVQNIINIVNEGVLYVKNQ